MCIFLCFVRLRLNLSAVMMKVLAFLLLFVGSSLADREFAELSSLFDDDLIHELEKRLMDYEDSDSGRPYSHRPTNAKCKFDVQPDLIIQTKVSQEQGAVFIDSPNVANVRNGRQLCQQKCCDTENCNLAVFKEDVSTQSCYLFNCGEPSKCNFSSHEGYTRIGLTGGYKYDQMVSAQKNQHAEDLENLAAKTTTTTTPQPTKPPKKPAVPLFGTCEEDKDCAGSGTECLASYCVCAEGHHPQDGICRESCTRFQFECKNEGQPLMNPQCVAIYDTCDGVQHCKDGSDEQNCAPATKKVDQNTQGSGAQILPQQQNIQSQLAAKDWLDTGDFVSGNEPVLQRGRQYPELMGRPPMYQQPQELQQAVSSVQQSQQMQPVALSSGQQPQLGRPQQQAVQQQAVGQSQSVMQPASVQVQQPQQPVKIAQQPAGPPQALPRPRPTVEKPPTLDYESNPPPRRRPSAGQAQQAQIQRPKIQQQGNVQVAAPQADSQQAQSSDSAQGPGRAQHPGKAETVVSQQPSQMTASQMIGGRHQSVSPKKGNLFRKPTAETSAGSPSVQQNQASQSGPGQRNRQKLVNPGQQQAASQQHLAQAKGYYSDGGFIPANSKNQRPGFQGGQLNNYRNIFNKDRLDYQYQNPFYAGQRPYGRQYDNSYDYNYAYADTPQTSYNYAYNPDFQNNKKTPTKADATPGNSPPLDGDDSRKVAKENPDLASGTIKEVTRLQPASPAPNKQQQQSAPPGAAPGGKSDVNPSRPSQLVSPLKTKTNSQDSDQQQQVGDTAQRVSSSGETSAVATSKTSSDTSSDVKEKKPDISVAKVEVGGGKADLVIEEASVVETVKHNKVSNGTAIIVLAMGLGITAILLMFVGCRLRNVKRRLRRGRPLNSNEADYLINGMYL